ncbi:hypothetical protein [Schlesneria paludicola]|nr:hypothetical protein [Schlesneria paludicola]
MTFFQILKSQVVILPIEKDTKPPPELDAALCDVVRSAESD